MVDVSTEPLTEILPRGAGARAFVQERRPGFADCAPGGRARLDALACWLQDAAYCDMEDTDLAQAAVWVARRTRVRVNRFPRFGEHFLVSTWCSGMGPMWAERRTDVTRAAEDAPDVEAVCLWVHLDPVTFRPFPLLERERTLYGGGGAAERRVSARLRHPPPDPEPEAVATWRFRATECDLAGHVNNAAYWAPLEEELLAGPEPRTFDGELEYRAASQPGERLFVARGRRRWLLDGDGEVYASFALGDGR